MLLAEAHIDIKAKTEKYKLSIKSTQADLKRRLAKMGEVVKKHEKEIRKLGLVFTAVGGSIMGSLAGMVRHATKLGDSLDKMSLRTGVSVEALSELSYAVKISGSDVNALETSFRFLARRMDESRQGTGIAKEQFDKLGISVADSTGEMRPSVDVMKEVATGIAGLTSESEKVATAMDIFGARSGPQLLPLLKAGGAGIDELMKKARELGLTISTDSAKASAEFADRMTDLRDSVSAAAYKIGNVLLPILTPLIEKMVVAVKAVSEWIKEHPKLTKAMVAFAGVMGGLMAAGGPMLILAPTLIKITAAMKAMIPIVIGLTGPWGLAAGAIGLAAAGLLAYNLASRDFKAVDPELAKLNTELKKQIDLLSDSGRYVYHLQKALNDYKLKGLDPTTATLGDLNIAYSNLDPSMRTLYAETQNAVGLLTDYVEKTKEQRQALDDVRGRITEHAKAMLDVADGTDKAAKATKALNAELGKMVEAGKLWWLKPRVPYERKRLPPVKEKVIPEAMPEAEEPEEPFYATLEGLIAFNKRAELLRMKDTENARKAAEKKADWIREEENKLADFLEKFRQSNLAKSAKDLEEELALIGDRNARREALEIRDNKKIRLAKEQSMQWEREAEQKTADFLDKLRQSKLAKDKAALEEYKASLEEYRDKIQAFIRDIRYAMEDLFVGLMTGKAKDAWEQFWEDLKQIAIRKLAALAADAVFKKVTEAFAPELAPKAAKDAGMSEGIKTGIGVLIGSIVGSIVPGVGTAIGAQAGGTIGTAFAEGGIVRRPTLAMIGERGPEAVIPLNKAPKFGLGGSSITVNFYETDFANMDRTKLEKTVKQQIIPIIQQAAADGIGA